MTVDDSSRLRREEVDLEQKVTIIIYDASGV